VRETAGPGGVRAELVGKWCCADSGTWTAIETTITTVSRSGKTTVYSLEKRNHPKNRDPMIVLDGQTFVTFYDKPPW